ncbi:hypothetical protein [Halomonas sp. YLGW01]|uniref:hypothetical protein n=1 Tax=Halomonas sp. YLGW01 TaxID=2773308 RepID=UPI001784E594|nr:hypothetical protein [Halomonas sp. YLGW01]
MNTVINLKTLTAGLAASLLMAGSALAMDSEAVEKHMAMISEETAKSDQPRVEALEKHVQELEELIRMMIEEKDAGS